MLPNAVQIICVIECFNIGSFIYPGCRNDVQQIMALLNHASIACAIVSIFFRQSQGRSHQQAMASPRREFPNWEFTGEEFQPSQTTFYHLDHENHFSRRLPVRVAYECRSCAPQFYCGHPIRESSRLSTSAYLNLPSIQYFHFLHRHLLLLLCVSAVTDLSVR